METGKINVLHVTTDPKTFRNVSGTLSSFFLTTATETEFKGLLDEFLEDNEFERNEFMDHVSKNGYICTYLDNEAITEF